MEKILIVDDSIFAVEVLKDILQQEYEVISANDGESGLETAHRISPSLILLDIEMPDMNGFEVLEKIKQSDDISNVPVIFLTGMTDVESEEKGFLMGAADYIKKPYNRNIVCARVRNQIKVFKYHNEIERQLQYDVLTGVYSRRNFESKLMVSWKNAIKYGEALSFAILDIDHFKKLNDTYGHVEGDRALRKVAKTIEHALPIENNFVARYGGEEFVVIFPNTPEHMAENYMMQVSLALAQERIRNENSGVAQHVTLSIGGITIIPDDRDSVLAFIESADRMLYKSKQNGRNQMSWCSQIIV